MHSATVILLLSLVELSNSVNQVQDSTGKLVDEIMSKFFVRVMSFSPLHHSHLDDTLLEKPSHLENPSRTSLRSLSPLSAHRFEKFTHGHLASPLGGYRLQLPRTKPAVNVANQFQEGPQTSTPKQLLQFTEPETNVTVKLVGCMHYNPQSKQLAYDTVEQLAKEGKLGSVILESCDQRWASFKKSPPLMQKILRSEMQVAFDLGKSYNRPVILGDQRFKDTGTRVKEAFKETIMDLASPPQGWQRVIQNITKIIENDVLPKGDAYLGLSAFQDSKLVLGIPEAVVKYLAAYLFKFPVPTIAILGSLAALTNYEFNVPDDYLSYGLDGALGLVLTPIEYLLLARIIFKVLLEQRNEILAGSILEECRVFSKRASLLSSPVSQERSVGTMYAYDLASVDNSTKGDEAVVAILGMAHCNGIMKLLKERVH